MSRSATHRALFQAAAGPTIGALLWLALAASPAQAQTAPTTVSCGQTLTHSVRLANDLHDCPANGLVIAADGITLDLNGHAIDGTVVSDCEFPGAENLHFGVLVASGHDGAIVENGTIREFDVGLQADGTSGLRVQSLALMTERFAGVALFAEQLPGNDDNTVEDNHISDTRCGGSVTIGGGERVRVRDNRITNSQVGVYLCCGNRNLVAENTVSGAEHDAMIVCCGDSHNTIRANTVTDGEESGILVCCADGADQHDLVVGNTVARNADAGIALEGANANAVRDNRVFANGDDIAADGDRNAITGNQVSDAIGCPDDCGYGIALSGGESNLIADNTVSRTLLDGIHIASFAPDTAATTHTVVHDNRVRDAKRDGFSIAAEGDGPVTGVLLKANTARRSGDDGFDIRTAATTLTSNLATYNADLGIDAIPGVTDGGGNTAFANGNPLQCTNVLCAGPP